MTAGSTAAANRDRGSRAGPIAAAAGLLAAIVFVFAAVLIALGGASPTAAGDEPAGSGPGAGVSALAEREIPPPYLRLYEQAAARYGLDWAILAGIGKVECDHGRDPEPSCTRGGRGQLRRRGRADAVHRLDVGAVRRRCRRRRAAGSLESGGRDLRRRQLPARVRAPRATIAGRYSRTTTPAGTSQEVEAWAARYSDPPWRSPRPPRARPVKTMARGTKAGKRPKAPTCACRRETATPVRFMPGERAELAPGDGHLALVPAGAPATVQAMVVAGNELQDLPYGPGRTPRPAGSRRRGLLEHRELRALPRRCAATRGNRPREPARPGLRQLGRARPGPVGDDLRRRQPHAARLHRHRRPAAGHPPRRHRRRAQPRSKTARAGGSSITSPPGRTGRCATRRGCKVAGDGRPARSTTC